jgi:hypothetical protein
MTGECQEEFQHCVMKSEGVTNNSPRSSIVFKKSIPGPGGKRGHGLVKNGPKDVKPKGVSTISIGANTKVGSAKPQQKSGVAKPTGGGRGSIKKTTIKNKNK